MPPPAGMPVYQDGVTRGASARWQPSLPGAPDHGYVGRPLAEARDRQVPSDRFTSLEEGRGPGQTKTLKIANLLCKPGVTPAQTGCTLSFHLQRGLYREAGQGEGAWQGPTAWATRALAPPTHTPPLPALPAAGPLEAGGAPGGGGRWPRGQTVSSGAEHSTSLHSGPG